MQGWKNNNDPWLPLPTMNGESDSGEDISSNDLDNGVSSSSVLLAGLPVNPLYQMIDSQKYIEILEKKLEKLKSHHKEPTSKDIINSLALFEEDQMNRYIGDARTSEHLDYTHMYAFDTNLSTSSYFKRKFHPEQQALTAEELLELVKTDVLANVQEENQDGPQDTKLSNENDKSSGKSCDSQDNGNDVPENWANFEEMDQAAVIISSDLFADYKK